MLANEPRKNWIALGLLGVAAALFLVRAFATSAAWRLRSAEAAGWLLLAALGVLLWPWRNLNRTLAEIHADIRSGRQAPSTSLQRICFLLAFALIVVQVYDAFH